MSLQGAEARADKAMLGFLHDAAENMPARSVKPQRDIQRGPQSIAGVRVTDDPGADYERFIAQQGSRSRKYERDLQSRLEAGDTDDDVLVFAFFSARIPAPEPFSTPFDLDEPILSDSKARLNPGPDDSLADLLRDVRGLIDDLERIEI